MSDPPGLGGPTLEVLCRDEQETDILGRILAGLASPGRVIGLDGPLGAGKTRLARAIAEHLGADPSAISSPTYVLVHEYDSVPPIAHFDVYRLREASEFDALGPEEYFGGDGICLVEWAERVADRLPPASWRIAIRLEGDARWFRLSVDPATHLALAEIVGSSGLTFRSSANPPSPGSGPAPVAPAPMHGSGPGRGSASLP